MSQDKETLHDAYIWYKKAVEAHSDPFAMFALAALLLTGDSELLPSPSGSAKAAPTSEKPYYIDVDNLASFLGTDIGVNPATPTEAKFDFAKWLRAERKRIEREKRAQRETNTVEPQHCASHVDPVPTDPVEGERLMLTSADRGCVQAMLTVRISQQRLRKALP